MAFGRVEAARPGGGWSGQADGAGERGEGNEDPEQPEDGLALEDREGAEQHVDRDEEDERGHGGGLVGEVEGREAEDDETSEQRRDHDGVERGPPLLGPVDVFEVDPQRELIEGESRTDAEERREDVVPGTVRLEGEAEESRAQQEHDPPDEVMDVQAALRLDAPGPPGHAGAADQAGARANEEEGREEGRQQHEAGALAGFVEEVLGDLDVQSHLEPVPK